MATNLNDIFKDYAINNILPKDSLSERMLAFSDRHVAFNKSNSFVLEDSGASVDGLESYRPPKQELRDLVGKLQVYPEDIGSHPDFANLDENESTYHYIVSVFLDIKGSTKLATKLPLEDVKFIKNGTIITAIDIFQAFNGHIHRLQGDAVFAFFVG